MNLQKQYIVPSDEADTEFPTSRIPHPFKLRLVSVIQVCTYRYAFYEYTCTLRVSDLTFADLPGFTMHLGSNLSTRFECCRL